MKAVEDGNCQILGVPLGTSAFVTGWLEQKAGELSDLADELVAMAAMFPSETLHLLPAPDGTARSWPTLAELVAEPKGRDAEALREAVRRGRQRRWLSEALPGSGDVSRLTSAASKEAAAVVTALPTSGAVAFSTAHTMRLWLSRRLGLELDGVGTGMRCACGGVFDAHGRHALSCIRLTATVRTCVRDKVCE